MSVFITFAAALLIFGAVIAIHEFGHFAVAKLCGVQVNEFSIGMGPTLIKTYRKGTQYTLRLLPVGGFVALEGEESPESEQAEGGSGDDDGPDIPPEVLAQRDEEQQHHEAQHEVHHRACRHHQHPLPDRGLIQRNTSRLFLLGGSLRYAKGSPIRGAAAIGG